TMFLMSGANRQQRVHAFLRGLTDPDQNARGESHGRLPRVIDCAQAKGGDFVGRFPMRAAGSAEPRASALEHQPCAYVRLAKAAKIFQAHQSRIGMGKKTSFFEYQLAHSREV